ncbi:MAG: thioredoxin family protein [Acidobacteria bacterium]|nr:thioredoxin family protein [Acidobacteriota bacterium]
MSHIIELFVADHCLGCPDARARVQEFAASRPDIVVVERDVLHHLDEARRYGLIATPAIVLDGRTILYGAPTSEKLAAHCERLEAAATG